MLLMLPYMFLLTIAGNGINFKEYIYIPKKENDANWVIENSYDELREKSIIDRVSIDKLFYNDSEPIKLFLRIDDNEITNELIEKLCPGITPYDRYSYSFRPFDILDFNIKEHYKSISYKEHKAKLETSISCTSKINSFLLHFTIAPKPTALKRTSLPLNQSHRLQNSTILIRNL